MFVHYRTQGFVFKKEDRGEADLLFTFYTKDFGKIEVLGKAIRKISSKLRPAAEIFHLSEIEFIQGKTYRTLTDAILIEKFENIKTDLKKLRVAYKASEVLDGLIRGQEPDERIWKLLKEVFEKLNNWKVVEASSRLPERSGGREMNEVHRASPCLASQSSAIENSLEIIHYYFFWNLVSLLGYQPDLRPDSICGKKIDGDLAKILKIIIKRNWQVLSRLKFTSSHLKLLKNISRWYNKEVCITD